MVNATQPLADLLREVSGWGPFFAVETHPAGGAPTPPWRGMRELLGDPNVLCGRIGGIRDYLAKASDQPTDAVETRVAASVTQMGLTGRLVSPALGFAVLGGWVPAMDLDNLWWQPSLGSMFPLSVPDGPGGTMESVISGPITDLVRSTLSYSVSERVLWGNVASTINGAATMIGSARPDLADRATELVDALLRLPPLRNTSTRTSDGRFQRRSCCLIYRATPTKHRHALCADCVLAASSE